jgi:hypothetical protein
MNKEQLAKVLELHKKWILGEKGGVKADLPNANLSRAYLSGANLSGADLAGADLRGTNLSRADLSEANLSGANLSRANLSGADLSGAYLSRANLFGANLFGANLSGANLSGADLSGADLLNAKNELGIIKSPIKLDFCFNKHTAVYFGGMIRIGCENYPLSYWLQNYEKIGLKHNYTLEEIKAYGQFIKFCAEVKGE